jgi:hypothetical protein
MQPTKVAMVMAAGALISSLAAQAQVPLSGACQTQFGVCPAPVAPVGAPCICGPGHQGRMIFMNPQGVGGPPPSVPMGNMCGTRFGVCLTPSFAPFGSPCGCGPDPGQIVR